MSIAPPVTSPRRLFLLSALAVLIGLLGGCAAYVLVHLIALLTNLAFFHRVGWTLPSFTHLQPSPMIVVLAVSVGLIVGARDKCSRVIRVRGAPTGDLAV